MNSGRNRGPIDAKLVAFTMETLSRAEKIRSYLENFDRELADHIKPLAMIIEGFDQNGDGKYNAQGFDVKKFNYVYERVIDKICTLNFYTESEKLEAVKQGNYRKNIEQSVKAI